VKEHTGSGNIVAYCLLFISFILLLGIFYIARSILIPFAIAGLLAYILYPAIAFIHQIKLPGIKKRIPYSISVFLVIAILLAMIGTLGFFLVGQANSFANSLPGYLSRLQGYIHDFSQTYDRLTQRLSEIIPGLTFSGNEPVSFSRLISGLISRLFNTILSLIGIFSNILIVLFMLVLILVDAPNFKEKLINAWGIGNRRQAGKLVVELTRSIRDFLRIRTLINLGLAVVMTGVLLLLGVDYAYIWGPLTGLLNYIPYIGAVVAALPPILVTLATHDTLTMPIVVALCYLVIQNIEGNYLSPRMIGDKVDLNSLTVLLSLIVWGFIWGPIGMILSTPLTTCFKIICDHVELLKPIGVLLGGTRAGPGTEYGS